MDNTKAAANSNRLTHIDLRARMWELKVTKGYTDEQIAHALKLERSYVTGCLNILGSEYLERIDKYAIGYKMQQVAQLENIIKEALEAWEWSKYRRAVPRGEVQAARAAAKESETKLDPYGDPLRIRAGNAVYLKVAMDAMDRLKLLLNLGATHIIRSEVDRTQELLDGYSIEELNRIAHGQYTIVDAQSTDQLSAGD